MAKNRSKGTITLTWSMDDESWSHWAQGRGTKTEQAVILEGLKKIRESREAREKIKSWCESIRKRQERELPGPESREAKQRRNQIEIQLPATDWGEALQLVGTPGNPVSTIQLLAAVILESETWKQRGNADAEYASGWCQEGLISSIAGSTVAHATGFSLAAQERIIAWIVAIAAVVTAVATVFIAAAEWMALCR